VFLPKFKLSQSFIWLGGWGGTNFGPNPKDPHPIKKSEDKGNGKKG